MLRMNSYSIGSLFSRQKDDVLLLTQVSARMVCLIPMCKTPNRCRDPLTVKDVYAVTQDELCQMSLSDLHYVGHMPDITMGL
jgi:hypothetical protein